jgi:hypothetical protein
VDALLFELSMIRCTKELTEEAALAAERRRRHGEKYLTTLYKEFREGIPEKEAYRIVLAEVRDTFLVTKVTDHTRHTHNTHTTHTPHAQRT